jgi:hypothetical protein
LTAITFWRLAISSGTDPSQPPSRLRLCEARCFPGDRRRTSCRVAIPVQRTARAGSGHP